MLAHKLREAIGAEQMQGSLSGAVEVDGAYFGGKAKRENDRAARKPVHEDAERAAKRQSVVVVRQRGGRTLPFVVAKESMGVGIVRQVVAPGSIVHADEARGLGRHQRPL